MYFVYMPSIFDLVHHNILFQFILHACLTCRLDLSAVKPRTNTRLDTNLIPRNKAPTRSGSTLSRPSTPLKRVGFPVSSQRWPQRSWRSVAVPRGATGGQQPTMTTS
jgi:hypothetical protein